MSERTVRKVLVVDDDEGLREVVVEYLKQRGYEVVEATNGLEALLHVKRERPDAVILDLLMPRLGGVEALKRIRAFDASMTIVVVSGTAGDVRQQADALGIAAVFDKPLDLPRLVAALGGAPAASEVPRPTPADPAPLTGRPFAARTVLVVDDDPGVRAMLGEFLTLKGCRVRSAADGVGAVRELVAAPADVVLLDIEMPGLNGVAALPTLRAVAPGAAIIMLSGTTNAEIARWALAAGAFDYLTKPMDLPRLFESIEAALAANAVGL